MILEFDKSWTLFLDRDGVINEKRENDYVKKWSEFSFINGSLDAISKLSKVFGKIVIVTNQRGVGKGLMAEQDLINIHLNMIREMTLNNGKIDKIYYCTDLSDESIFRKPNVGMGLRALSDFPEINFEKSIIIGDSLSDMKFGKSLRMLCVFISNKSNNIPSGNYDSCCQSLIEFANSI